MAPRLVIIILFAAAVNIFCQPGELYELSEIKFSGNSKISSSELEAVIVSEETPMWFFKFLNSFTPLGSEPVYFDSSNISLDMQALENYYKANGFFNASIDTSLEIDTTNKEVILTYEIIENEPSKYGSIRYFGLDSIPANIQQRIYAETMVNPDLFFTEQKISENINHVLEILLNRGYMQAIYNRTDIFMDTVANTAGIDFYFTPGSRFKISEIQVDTKGEGAPYVEEQMLKDLVGIEKDEYFNNQKIKDSHTRLVRTGLFQSIRLAAGKKDTTGVYVPLKLEGNIGLMNEILPGIAVNDEYHSSFNLGISANYTRKNFLGNARKLTLSSEVSVLDLAHFNFQDFFSGQNYHIDGYALVNLKLEQPYLFQKPILGILENYFKTSTLHNVNYKTYGTKATFDFEMPEFTFINQLSPYFNFEFYDAKINDYVRKDSLYFSNTNIFSRTSFLGVQFGSRKTDNLFFPTSGSNQIISLETAISFGEANINAVYIGEGATGEPFNQVSKSVTLFYRLEYTSTIYMPLSKFKTSVFAAKLKSGYVQAYSGNEDLIPGNRTFFAGGANSIRGWGVRDLPLVISYEVDGSDLLNYLVNNDTTNQKIRGGTFLFEGSFEVRQRFLENLGVAIFTDYGNVWNGYKMFRFDEIAVAAGFGIRYYSPIAPFRLDFGFKFYDPGKKLFIWDNWNPHFLKNLSFQFGIGEAF